MDRQSKKTKAVKEATIFDSLELAKENAIINAPIHGDLGVYRMSNGTYEVADLDTIDDELCYIVMFNGLRFTMENF